MLKPLVIVPIALGNDLKWICLSIYWNKTSEIFFHVKYYSVDYVPPPNTLICLLSKQHSSFIMGKLNKTLNFDNNFNVLRNEHRADNSETFESPLLDEITNHPQFNSRNPTTLYIHGYIEDQTSGTVVSMVQAYAKRGNNNFIALNWAIGASGPLYPISVRYAYRVSEI